jgi:hypothetical protein
MATAGPTDLRPQPRRADRLDATGTMPSASKLRRVAIFVALAVLVLVLWELVKWLGGVPWRFENALGTGLQVQHDPPFR